MSIDVLIIDDEADIRDLISANLKDEGFTTRTAAHSTGAFDAIAEKAPSAIILDIWLQGSDLDGLGILEIIKKRYPLMPVIIISGHGTIETAVTAIKMGAYDYIEKPFTHEKLMIVLKRACEASRLKKENIDLKSKVLDKTELVGNSAVINKLKNEIEKVAPTSGRILILGQSGSGKELVARLIHKKSKKAGAPFIIFNPTGMSADKIQQDLFGEPEKHDANAVFAKRHSVLEAANNGTLYIDEIGDLPQSTQAKLLKFLQDQILEKPAINKSIKLDVRIITSSSRDLQQEVTNGKFREDLFYRINVVPIKVPSLTDHREDIPLLIQYFVKQLAKFSGLKEREFAEDAINALQSYNWPGNIRELRNTIEWTLIMNPITGNDNTVIRMDMLPREILNNGLTISKSENNIDMMSMPLREAREVFERQYLFAQMNRFNNNISKTSLFVGMERSALHRKLKLLNIHTTAGKDKDDSLDSEEESDLIEA
jgi:two-component system nitrogen regulation response regulator NtrX